MPTKMLAAGRIGGETRCRGSCGVGRIGDGNSGGKGAIAGGATSGGRRAETVHADLRRNGPDGAEQLHGRAERNHEHHREGVPVVLQAKLTVERENQVDRLDAGNGE